MIRLSKVVGTAVRMAVECMDVTKTTRGEVGDGEASGAVKTKKKKGCLFKAPEDESEIQNKTKKQFVPESKRKIRWAVNLYGEWRSNRMGMPLCPP